MASFLTHELASFLTHELASFRAEGVASWWPGPARSVPRERRPSWDTLRSDPGSPIFEGWGTANRHDDPIPPSARAGAAIRDRSVPGIVQPRPRHEWRSFAISRPGRIE